MGDETKPAQGTAATSGGVPQPPPPDDRDPQHLIGQMVHRPPGLPLTNITRQLGVDRFSEGPPSPTRSLMPATIAPTAPGEAAHLASASGGPLRPVAVATGNPLTPVNQEPQEEKRVARDGLAYTRGQFWAWYYPQRRAEQEWAYAAPAWDADAILENMRGWYESQAD